MIISAESRVEWGIHHTARVFLQDGLLPEQLVGLQLQQTLRSFLLSAYRNGVKAALSQRNGAVQTEPRPKGFELCLPKFCPLSMKTCSAGTAC